MMSYSSPPASPDASRAAILGAASNGWSPQRQHKRDFFSPTTGSSSDMAEASMLSPTASPSRTFDPKALRSHGLVSNSIFKQPGSSSSASGSSSHPASPSRSAGLGRGAASPAAGRMGVGLGIGVEQQQQQQRQRGAFMPSRSSREELSSVAPSPSGAEVSAHGSALPPRKSKAYDMLTKSNYVTNSPFKSGGPHSPDATSPPTQTRPLSFAAEPPTTPTRSPHTEYFSTPRGPARSPANVTPSSRSALTSNRLHGPRQMSSGSPTKGASDDAAAAKQERRKTVTFDEEPDVQEFDKESSFDGQSLRSGDSNASLQSQDQQQQSAADRAYYSSQRQQLTIVNGSPSDSASSPEMREHDALSLSSADSRDLDSSEASLPSSPERVAASLGAEAGDVSYDKTWATAADETAKDNSYMSLGGLHRVDSMVDELLQADILSTPPIEEHAQEEKPVRRGAAPRPPQQPHQQREDEAAVESHLFLSKPTTEDRSLPTLPNWSPIMFDSKALPDFGGVGDVSQQAEISGQSTSESSAPSPPAEVPQPRRVGGRPHISRNAVLERVAKEKKAQAEAEASEQKQAEAPRGSLGLTGASPADTSMPVSRTATDVASRARPSAPAAASAARGPSSQPELTATRVRQERSSYEAKPQPTPSPVEEHTVGNVSPLDRIGGALAANDAAAAVADDSAAGSPWFNPVSSLAAEAEKPSTGIKREGAPTHLALPSSSSDPQDVAAPPSPALSTRSNLGPLPPAITPEQHAEQIIARRRSKNKGGRRKRSMSTGDAGVSQARAARAAAAAAGTTANEAEDANSPAAADSSEEIESLASDRASIQADLTASKLMLDHTVQRAVDEGFSNGLCRDISRIFRDGDSPYKVQDRGAFTSSVAEEKVSHSRQAGDVDAGKAWRKLRRPSDINEYAEEMRAYRANENPKKAAGKVFVMVDSFSPANMPVPSVPTKFFCILDNGLHVVKTGLSELNARSSVIGQEFELIQHKNLEFSLTLFVQQQQQQEEAGRAASPTKKESKTGSLTKSFMSRLLRSPKKDKSNYGHGHHGHDEQQSPQATMSAYTNREGAFGRVDLVFESVASSCLGKLLIIDLPVRGVADPLSSISGHASINSRRHADFPRNLSRPRGTLRLKLFYLPPMPSVPKRLLPENLRECLQGMESAAWASTPRIEGILTQQGGDCRTWRRRPVKAQGSFLICYNDVTKRPTVKIDLGKAKSIDESWDPYDSSLLKGKDGKMASRKSMANQWGADEEPDESYHVPNSFRITFADGEVLSFFADTDEERKSWVREVKGIIECKRGAPPMWASVAREIVQGVEKGLRPSSSSSAGSSAGSAAVASMSRQGSNMTASTTTASSSSTAGPGSMAASGSSGKLFAGNKVPPTVQEEAATPQRTATATPPAPSAPVAAPASTSSAGARPSSPVKRKPLPTFGSSGVSNSPMPSPWTNTNAERRPPLTPVTRTVGSASGGILRTPGQASTPMQQQRSAMALGGQGMGRPTLPTRPQSELFTPVRKGSVAFGQQQGTPRRA